MGGLGYGFLCIYSIRVVNYKRKLRFSIYRNKSILSLLVIKDSMLSGLFFKTF